MKKIFFILLFVSLFAGCHSHQDPRINVASGVGSDTLADNIVTRPVSAAFSVLVGQGIVVDKAVTRRNDAGFMELFVDGRNESGSTKKFRYRVEWFDEEGLLLETQASTWLPFSVTGKAAFTIKSVAPRTEAVNFRMDTRKWE